MSLEVVLADEGIAFDGASLDEGPLGGAESAFIAMAEALAASGCRVRSFAKGARHLRHKDVQWNDLRTGLPETADLYIGNRGHRLIGQVPRARRRVFWVHNPAGYLAKPRFIWPLLRWRPAIPFSGEYHLASCPSWLPTGRRFVLPYGIDSLFLGGKERKPPPPRVVFTSNPMRGLDWLLTLWCDRIRPAVPEAELHVYAGAGTYRAEGSILASRMEQVLERTRRLAPEGVRLFDPVSKPELKEALAGARTMLYGGDPGETFCLALGEAQAMGVPVVVKPVGCVAERVVDGVTGTVAGSDDDFASAAVRLLKDDDYWQRSHRSALDLQGRWGWPEAAHELLATILSKD